MENTSTLLVLAFNTTIQFKRKILDFSGTNITFTEKTKQDEKLKIDQIARRMSHPKPRMAETSGGRGLHVYYHNNNYNSDQSKHNQHKYN